MPTTEGRQTACAAGRYLTGAIGLARSPPQRQTNPRQPTPPHRRFKVSAIRIVDDHGACVGFTREFVAAQECAPARISPLPVHADACAEHRPGVEGFVADLVGYDAALLLDLSGEVDAAGLRLLRLATRGVTTGTQSHLRWRTRSNHDC